VESERVRASLFTGSLFSWDIRILPLQPLQINLNFLFDLKPPLALTDWIQGFDQESKWHINFYKQSIIRKKTHEEEGFNNRTCLEDKIPFYKQTAVDKCQESGKIVGTIFFFVSISHDKKMISSYFIDVIGGLYEIGEMITIKTSKASTKREIKIIDQSNNKVRKTYLQNI
jgi:hypothetical protein